jgi:hypothetical protein
MGCETGSPVFHAGTTGEAQRGYGLAVPAHRFRGKMQLFPTRRHQAWRVKTARQSSWLET